MLCQHKWSNNPAGGFPLNSEVSKAARANPQERIIKKPTKHFISVVISICCVPLSIASAATYEEPPESITLESLQELYEPVNFDHAMHMDSYDCSSCHHHTLGDEPTNPICIRCHLHPTPSTEVNCATCHLKTTVSKPQQPDSTSPTPVYHIDILKLKGAYHLLCVNCHQKEAGPTECLECQDFTAAGRKRFQVNTADTKTSEPERE